MPFSGSSLIALVPALAGVAMFAAVFAFLVIIAVVYIVVLQPLLDWTGRSGSGFLGRVIKWVTRPVARLVARYAKRHIAAIATSAIAHAPAAIRLLDNGTEITQRLAGTLADEAEATYKALYKLRHSTVPALIEAKVQPLWNRLAVLSDRLGVTEGRIQDAGQLITGTLGRLPWGAPIGFVPALESWLGSYRHLWNQVFSHIQPRLNDIYLVKLPDIWKRLDALESGLAGKIGQALQGIRLRVAALENLLAGVTPAMVQAWKDLANPTLFAFAVAAALDRLIPNLRCRNVTDVTQRLCRTNEQFLLDLLSGALLWALVVDPRILARSAEAVTGGLGGIIRETAIR